MFESNQQVVLQYLMAGKKITTKQAMDELGIADLQSVIRYIRKNIEVKDNWVDGVNRRGRNTRHKEYYMDMP
jgi:hypothetical protein